MSVLAEPFPLVHPDEKRPDFNMNHQVNSTYEESHNTTEGTHNGPAKSSTGQKTPTCERDSHSEQEDLVYIPFEFRGDGRKREAKRHKSQAMVA